MLLSRCGVAVLVGVAVLGTGGPASAFDRGEKLLLTHALSGRTRAARKVLVARHGGSEASEAAVDRALAWIAKQQLEDGSWSFDRLPGEGGAGNPRLGSLKNGKAAATGLALLPLLGAGHTHTTGDYKREVEKGLKFLIAASQPGPEQAAGLHNGGGHMYAHGIASIALAEAHAMTRDEKLAGPAQAALNFVAYAQDPVGGGWRYQPRQAGDTSVFGWQLAALETGRAGKLEVAQATFDKAAGFLDSVADEGGAAYGYTTPGNRIATTAIGLLGRMELGWKRDHPPLAQGISRLAKTGPSANNFYYNYYASQAMFHYGGEPWEKWNAAMRGQLVQTQVRDGKAAGSWYVDQGSMGADRGGALYCTSMATLVLEIYYRHLPIYRDGG